MRIEQVSSPSFKGRAINVSLKPVNLVIAGNFDGKTSLADAIRFGLFGYVPRYGKANELLVKAFGNPVEVELRFNDDAVNHVRIFENDDGGFSRKLHLSYDLPPVLIDTNTYFEKTRQQRLTYLFKLMNPKEHKFDAVTFAETVAEESSPSTELIFADLKSSAKRVTDLAAWLSTWTDAFTIKAKYHKGVSAQKAEALSHLREISPGHHKDVSVQIDELDAKVLSLSTELQLSEKADETAGRIRNLEADIVEAGEFQRSLKRLRANLDKLRRGSHEMDSKKLDAINAERLKLQLEADAIEDAILKVETPKGARCPLCLSAGPQVLKALQQARQRAAKALEGSKPRLDAAIAARSAGEALARLQDEYKLKLEFIDSAKAKQALLTTLKSRKTTKGNAKWVLEKTTELESAKEQLSELRTQQSQRTAYVERLKSRERLEEESVEAGRTAGKFLRAAQACQEAIKDLTYISVGKLLETARAFTGGILRSDLEMIDGNLGRRVSQADIDHGCLTKLGSWIPSDAFSGTEEMIALAGFAVALAGTSPYRLVIMDELGRLEPALKPTLITRMGNLVKRKVIDQFIGIDVAVAPYLINNNSPVNIVTP